KLVEGRSNRKYSSEEEAAEAAKAAGYTDIYKQVLIGITEMEKLMGKKKFAQILGKFVYKPQGKITLAPESDKRQPVETAAAEADFKEE
ncbi:nuclease, partial [Lachnotalea glycerini]